jgi:hypothetical protein
MGLKKDKLKKSMRFFKDKSNKNVCITRLVEEISKNWMLIFPSQDAIIYDEVIENVLY